MVKGSQIIIEPVANGWLVHSPFNEYGLMTFADMQVFNLLDYDAHGVQSELTTLLGFIKAHFTSD